jgi:hypothetical protein
VYGFAQKRVGRVQYDDDGAMARRVDATMESKKANDEELKATVEEAVSKGLLNTNDNMAAVYLEMIKADFRPTNKPVAQPMLL